MMAGNTHPLPEYLFHACVFELCDACVDTSTGKLRMPYAGDASSETPACKIFFTAHCPVLRMCCSEFISKCSAYFCDNHRNEDCWIYRYRSAEHWKYSIHAHMWRTHKICGHNFGNNKNRTSIRAIFYFYFARIRNFRCRRENMVHRKMIALHNFDSDRENVTKPQHVQNMQWPLDLALKYHLIGSYRWRTVLERESAWWRLKSRQNRLIVVVFQSFFLVLIKCAVVAKVRDFGDK